VGPTEEFHYRPNVSYNPKGAEIDVMVVTKTDPLMKDDEEVYPGNPAGLNVTVITGPGDDDFVEFQLTAAQLVDAAAQVNLLAQADDCEDEEHEG
jgi:hypothetical protein